MFSSYIKFIIWVVGLFLFYYWQFWEVYIIFSCFYLIFTNLGERKPGEWSAWSVFNKNMQAIPGTVTADQLESEMLHRIKPKYEENNESSKSLKHRSIIDQINEETKQIKRTIKAKTDIIEEVPDIYPQKPNEPCQCHSGLKFKSCCGKLLKKMQSAKSN